MCAWFPQGSRSCGITSFLTSDSDRRHRSRESHSYHPARDSADGTKNGLGWCDARKRLREVQAFNDYVQRAEVVVSTFRSSGLCLHEFKVNVGAKEKAAVRNLLRKPGVTAAISVTHKRTNSRNTAVMRTDGFKPYNAAFHTSTIISPSVYTLWGASFEPL